MVERVRAAWLALRGYAAAQDHRASAWAPSGGSANAEVGLAAATVARRARDAVRNDPYASRIVDLWTGNAVGAGITTRWPGSISRQRTTPWLAGIGPASIAVASAARWASVSRGGEPGGLRSTKPSGPPMCRA